MKKQLKIRPLSADHIRRQLDTIGYAVEDVGSRENYLIICGDLGTVTHTREIFLKPKDMVKQFTGYSHLPDEVPFHTDHPHVNVVGLFCEEPDDIGGENLLMDSRDILSALTSAETEALKATRVPLPKSDDSMAILTVDAWRPHTYWLPALALSGAKQWDDVQASAVQKFSKEVCDRRNSKQYLSFKLNAGQAIWFDNFVMLHGRDRLEPASRRFQVRAFIRYREDEKKSNEGGGI